VSHKNKVRLINGVLLFYARCEKRGNSLSLKALMPIYEYVCAACRSTFEELVNADERDSCACPQCAGQTQRLISSFAGRGKAAKSENKSAAHSCGSPGCCRIARN